MCSNCHSPRSKSTGRLCKTWGATPTTKPYAPLLWAWRATCGWMWWWKVWKQRNKPCSSPSNTPAMRCRGIGSAARVTPTRLKSAGGRPGNGTSTELAPRSHLSEVGFGERPVHQFVQERFHELAAQVAVVDVVGVFPHVHGQQGLVGCGQRGASGAGVDDVHGTVGLFHQPGPAGTEIAHSGFDKRFFEGGVAAPFGVDGRSQGAGGLTTAVGLHAAPEKGVVPDLGGVVVHTTAGFFHDGLEVHGFELGALLQVV